MIPLSQMLVLMYSPYVDVVNVFVNSRPRLLPFLIDLVKVDVVIVDLDMS